MKKYILKSLALFLLSLLLFAGINSNDEQLTNLLSNFEKFGTDNPQEKIHLHLDKPFYSVGDEIWFKAYLVNAEENKLSLLSKVMYIDLIDERDSVQKTIILPLENGLASGNISLTDSLFTAGTYQIRAYTNWMRNAGESYFFHKTIPVGDAFNSALIANANFNITSKSDQKSVSAKVSYKDFNQNLLVNKDVSYQLIHKDELLFSGQSKTNQQGEISFNYTLKKNDDPEQLILKTTIKKNEVSSIARIFKVAVKKQGIDMQFFPEGGNLVQNIRSKVAFKAIGMDGIGLTVEGYVEDQNHQKIADIKVDHAGMGMFAITPELGKSYTAKITDNGQEKIIPLPKAMGQGYVLSLNHLGNNDLIMRIDCSPSMIDNKEVVLVAQSNGVFKHVSKFKMDKTTVSAKLSKDLFTDGITQFTLFSPDLIPVAERLIFVQQQHRLKVNVVANKNVYKKREKVDLSIQVADLQEKGVVGSFSMAVVNQDKVNANEDDEMSILSNLLLTSDLKGYIEKPNYYFTDVDQQKIRALDVLMLTQGWRRFKWEDIQQPKKEAHQFLPQKGLSISGTITNLSNKAIPYGKVNLFVPSMMALIDTVADVNGHFTFEELYFPDSTKFIVRAKNAKDRDNVRIVIDPKLSIPIDRSLFNPFSDPLMANAFLNYLSHTEKMYNEMDKYGVINKGIRLNEVVIEKKKQPEIYRSAIPKVVRPDYTITPENLQSAGNISAMLTGLSGVIIKFNKIYGRSQGKEGQMLVLLDGVPLSDIDGVAPNSLAGVQIIRSGMVAAGVGNNYPLVEGAGDPSFGIVFLTTERRATKYNTTTPSGLSRLKPTGYAIVKEFYTPNYEVADQKNQMADLRTTIYWAPNLITNEDGKANLSFFTADEPGKYLVTLEGVSLAGQLTRKTFNFSVQ